MGKGGASEVLPLRKGGGKSFFSVTSFGVVYLRKLEV